MSGDVDLFMVSRAILSCPWCPWTDELRFALPAPLDEARDAGDFAIADHERIAGHSVGLFEYSARARVGFYQGRPVS